jgi:hypothetical protein
LIPYFLESGFSDASDLDPSDGDRIIRKTINLRAEGWIFDTDYTTCKVIRRIEVQVRDIDTDELYDTIWIPAVEITP